MLLHLKLNLPQSIFTVFIVEPINYLNLNFKLSIQWVEMKKNSNVGRQTKI